MKLVYHPLSCVINKRFNSLGKKKKLDAFPLKSGKIQECPLPLLLFASTIRQEKEIKGIQFEKDEINLCSGTHVCLCRRSQRNNNKKTLKTK